MHRPALHVFKTALGHCGIAWNAHGVAGIQLPEGNGPATLKRLRRRFSDGEVLVPDGDAAHAVAALVDTLAGGQPDLDDIVLDMREVPSFGQRVYEIARAIPRGNTLTYGEVAARLGDASLAREVGRALGANPFPIIVPCHRVLAATGLGGFSAHGGAATKRRLLTLEGTPGLQLSMFDTDDRR